MYYYLIYNSENVVTAHFTNDTPCNFGTEVTREEYDAILTAAGIPHVMPEEPTPAEPEPTADEILNAMLGVE